MYALPRQGMEYGGPDVKSRNVDVKSAGDGDEKEKDEALGRSGDKYRTAEWSNCIGSSRSSAAKSWIVLSLE